MKKGLLYRIGLAIVAIVVIVYFYPRPENNRYYYEKGRPWNYSKLIAPFDIPIHADSATILAAKDSLNAHFVPIYGLNQLLIDTIISRLPDKNSLQSKQLATELRKVYASGVVDMSTKELISAGKLPRIRILDKNILSEMSTANLMSPRDTYLYLDSIISDSTLRKYFAHANLQSILQPNYTRNETECKRLFEYDYLTLTADRGVILQGQTIIDKGAIISAQDFTNIQTYEELLSHQSSTQSNSFILMIIGQFIYISLIISSLIVYLYVFTPEIFSSNKYFTFIIMTVTLFFLISIGLNYFATNGIYIAPIMIVTILILTFFDGRTALMTTGVLTLILAGITSFAFEYILLQFCAASVTVYSLRVLRQRSQLLRASFLIASAYIISYTSLELLLNGTLAGFSWKLIAYLGVNSALCSIAYILMSLFERTFGFTSAVTLLELTDITNPLLMRLSNECPGTFQHSIAVSNLAADAAAKIGANVPLVRAGALYHDIGKVSNPNFFTENQHGVNPHDALPPERSASIVINHVTDGLKLAERAGLPSVIRSFIAEHHGKGTAKYFYYTACQQNGEENTPIENFSYPGPNPRSRETSILMMADAIEAASRSLKTHTQEAITNLVNKIIDSQIADGLHSDSLISLRDVTDIKEVFIKRLMTIYHSRIAYPSASTSDNH